MMVYLANPIDQGKVDTEPLINALLGQGHAVFDPSKGWQIDPLTEPDAGLMKGNLALLRKCDIVVGVLDAKILSVGVLVELTEAARRGIPAAILSETLYPSWALVYLEIPVFTTRQDLFEWMEEA